MPQPEPPRPRWDEGAPALKETLAALAGLGFDPEQASELITSVSRILAEQLGDARGERGVIDVMRATVQLASRAVRGSREDAARRSLPVASTACVTGCSHCCRVHVAISPPEAIVLAAFLRDTTKPAALAALTARVEEAAQRVRAMDRDARHAAHLDCPLLEGDRCVAYQVRPLTCAGANSLDAAACAAGGEIPIEPIQLGALRATQIALSTASLARGLDYGRYELSGALAVALRTKDAASRWLAGERLFEATPADPSADKIGAVAAAFVARDSALSARGR